MIIIKILLFAILVYLLLLIIGVAIHNIVVQYCENEFSIDFHAFALYFFMPFQLIKRLIYVFEQKKKYKEKRRRNG